MGKAKARAAVAVPEALPSGGIVPEGEPHPTPAESLSAPGIRAVDSHPQSCRIPTSWALCRMKHLSDCACTLGSLLSICHGCLGAG